MDPHLDLSRRFISLHPVDAVRILEQLPAEDVARFLEQIPAEMAAQVLKLMDSSRAPSGLQHMDPVLGGAVVEGLPLDAAAVLLRRMGPDDADAILSHLANEQAELLRLVLSHPDGTAGTVMDPRILTLPEDIDAGEALERVRSSAERATYYLYVLDRDDVLIGVLTMRELMLADPSRRVSDVMSRDVARLRVDADRAQILSHPGWLTVHALPVVDRDGVFVGAIRYDTLRDLQQQAAGRTAGVQATAAALGELYRTGISGVMSSAATLLQTQDDHNA